MSGLSKSLSLCFQMAPCPKCDGFSKRLNIRTPDEYLAIVRQLIERVNTGTFLLVNADCPLGDILGPTWPGDSIAHEFECFTCGRRFRLHADTFHGHADWTPG